MRKILLSSCIALLVAAIVWAGGDPWKSKPYQQWDAKDIRKVLDSSPWARSIQVEAPWLNGDATGGADSGTAQPGPTRPGAGARTGPGGGAVDSGAGGGPAQAALATFLVRWSSSRTIREAVARNEILAGQMKQDAAEQQLAQPVESYDIVVAGPDMKPFQSVDEKILQNGAFLMDRKTKQKVAPTSVKIQSSADGKTIQSVAFIFPKKSDSGISTIGADQKTVDFLCVVTNVKIDVSFDTTKMVDTLGRDL
ncbi:MAG: hypothetical protein ABSC10_17330 [Candidatus Acidiferrales bacterium]